MQTFEECVPDQLLHAQTGTSVSLSLTLSCRGPVLNPGVLTKYILIPEKSKVKSTFFLGHAYNPFTNHNKYQMHLPAIQKDLILCTFYCICVVKI